jgi:hypothetical protein
MLEKDKKITLDSISSVMPYVACPEELRETIEKETENCDSIGSLVEKLEKTISMAHDAIGKTDMRIFLNELERNIAKSSSD